MTFEIFNLKPPVFTGTGHSLAILNTRDNLKKKRKTNSPIITYKIFIWNGWKWGLSTPSVNCIMKCVFVVVYTLSNNLGFLLFWLSMRFTNSLTHKMWFLNCLWWVVQLIIGLNWIFIEPFIFIVYARQGKTILLFRFI